MPEPSTLVLLKGGHKTLIRGQTVSEVEDVVTLARRDQREVASVHEFVYIQPRDDSEPVNSLAVDPFAVVAIIAVD